ncbi:MAG: acetyl-CoA hydrolase/transferase family protein [Gemmatimonadaceae bacterium]|nr:acetyl-CoA hydrolase/transferase family protein [Gemmatimonadaceae bacterium]
MPAHPRSSDWRQHASSPADVVSHIKSGDRIFIHGACATPTPLLEALAARTDLRDVQLYHLHLAGEAPFVDREQAGHFSSNSLFSGANVRAAIGEGRADFIPVFLSDIPSLFADRVIDLDVAILQLSPPDKHGNSTLGTSVDCALAASLNARTVLAEINQQMPRTAGNSAVPLSRVDAWTATDRPLHTHAPSPASEIEDRIGETIAGLVEDGSTLQLGIGGIPDAVLARLGNKVGLGVHSEMFSDGLIPLMENGVVTNEHKEVHRGRTVTSFINGSKRLFDFVDDNLAIEFHPCDRTNDPSLIRENPKVVAINSAIEIDLTGQVCADSIGHRIYSGIGGQMDFIRGAALSKGGKPIIALPSMAAGGTLSRITHELKPGAGVVTTRGHVHWVVTEYGAVNLHGKTLRQRAELLISIAHPDVRGELTRATRATRHFAMV